jgi:hypothetical protein
MADLPVQPVQNFGQLLSSYGEGLADQENAATNRLNAQTSLTQVPSEIAARQAGTAFTGAQTAGKGIENQTSALMLQLTKNALRNYAESADAAAAPKPGSDNEGGSDVGSASENADTSENADNSPVGTGTVLAPKPPKTNPDTRFKDDDDSAAHFDQVASDKFRVNPAFTPSEQALYNGAIPLALAGHPERLDAAKQVHDQRVQNQIATSQTGSQKAADQLYAVNTAPAGSSFTALKGAFPAAAAHLAKIHDLDPDHPEKWTPDEQADLDANAKKYAGGLHNALFQYTGDKLEDKNGQNRNSRTGQLPIGDQTQGLSPEQWADKYKEATTLDTIPDPAHEGQTLQIAHWRTQGFQSPNAYVRGTSGNAATAPGSPIAGATTVGNKNQPVTGSGPDTTATAATPGAAPPTLGNLTQDPSLRKMLADPDFNPPKLPPSQERPAGSFGGMSKQEQDRQTARTELLKDGEDATRAAALSNQYLVAAKQILDSKQVPTTGPLGHLLAQASALMPGQHVDASNYQEVAKYLGNAALANAKGIYGSRMTQSEVGLQLNELSPSVKMTDQTIRNLLDQNIRSSQYTIDSASRARSYLAAGKDPQNFAKAEQRYFPRDKIVNAPGSDGSNAAPAPNVATNSRTAPAAKPPVAVKNRAEAMALQPGTIFTTPDGRTLVR